MEVKMTVESGHLLQAWIDAFRQDPDWAHSWYANIACIIHDTLSDTLLTDDYAWKLARESAHHLMKHLFGLDQDEYMPETEIVQPGGAEEARERIEEDSITLEDYRDQLINEAFIDHTDRVTDLEAEFDAEITAIQRGD